MSNIRNLTDLNKRLSALSQITIQTTYKCPICGKEHHVNDCVIIKEEVDSRIHEGFEMLNDGHTVKDHYVKMVHGRIQYQLVAQNVYLPNTAVVWG